VGLFCERYHIFLSDHQPAGPHLRGDEVVMRRRRLLEKVGEGAALEQTIKEGTVRTVADEMGVKWMDGLEWMDGWMDGCDGMGGRMDGWVHEWMHGRDGQNAANTQEAYVIWR
jgi:hypothetical protein